MPTAGSFLALSTPLRWLGELTIPFLLARRLPPRPVPPDQLEPAQRRVRWLGREPCALLARDPQGRHRRRRRRARRRPPLALLDVPGHEAAPQRHPRDVRVPRQADPRAPLGPRLHPRRREPHRRQRRRPRGQGRDARLPRELSLPALSSLRQWFELVPDSLSLSARSKISGLLARSSSPAASTPSRLAPPPTRGRTRSLHMVAAGSLRPTSLAVCATASPLRRTTAGRSTFAARRRRKATPTTRPPTRRRRPRSRRTIEQCVEHVARRDTSSRRL